MPPYLSIRSSASASVCAGGRPGAWSDCSGAGAASRGGAGAWGRGLEQGRARGALWVGSCTSSADMFGVTLRYEDIIDYVVSLIVLSLMKCEEMFCLIDIKYLNI